MDNQGLIKAQSICSNIMSEVKKVIAGKEEAIELLLVALLSRGHVLIEDVPGVGKTTIAKALAKACGLDCKRQQFTPDVMASDITGFMMIDKKTGEFVFKSGVVMTNMLIADEINRTSPKTQSALLEVMEERVVTVDGTSRPLPDPFMVIATQNPTGYVGTYPLPEAQLDRFLMKISMGYPTLAEEAKIISVRKEGDPLSEVEAVAVQEDVLHMQQAIRTIHIDEELINYIVALIDKTRQCKELQLAASPRASLALMQTSAAYAFIRGRDYVIPEDVQRMFEPVVSHRLVLTAEAKIEQRRLDEVVAAVLKGVKTPATRK
ncbi:MAG: MoxR family ATPase [Clostridia bacterium]|nr:MoxR family ATPase [Clostridia bacterium]